MRSTAVSGVQLTVAVNSPAAVGWMNWLVDEFRNFPDHAMALGDLIAEYLVEGPAPLPYEISDWPAPPAETTPNWPFAGR